MAYAGGSAGDGGSAASNGRGAGRDGLWFDPSINWDAVSVGVEVVSYKWLLPVMAVLVDGPKRHSELSRAVELDHKRLGRVLRRAQEAQLVTREADVSGQQFSVRYQLTGYGRDLLSILALVASLTQGRDT